MKRRNFGLTALFIACGISTAVPSYGQTYPVRPIRMVVPFSAGSATDIVARVLSAQLSKALGKPIVVDNRPGAGAVLGTKIVAESPNDGYTLLLGANSGLVSGPAGLIDNVPYDPIKDLRYISLLGLTHYVWIANNEVPAKDAKEMLDYILARPREISLGVGNSGGLAYGRYLSKQYKLDAALIPYKSVPPAVADMMGGVVQTMVTDVATAIPLIRAGQVKALGVFTTARHPLLPDVPTFKDLELATPPQIPGWLALVGPSGMPEAIVKRLNAETTKILNTPEIRDKLLASGIQATPSTPEQAAAYEADQLEVWRTLVRELELTSIN